MSGDLLLAFCRAPHTPSGALAPEDGARPVLAARIAALPREVIEEVAWSRFGGMADSDACADCGRAIQPGTGGGFVHADGDEGGPDHEARLGEAELPGEHEVRNTLRASVDSLFQENRVCHTVVLDGRAWVVSGGISGGDSPTDEYDDLRALEVAGVTVEPIPDPSESPAH